MCCVAKYMNGVECFENSCFNWEGDILLLTVECPEFFADDGCAANFDGGFCWHSGEAGGLQSQ